MIYCLPLSLFCPPLVLSLNLSLSLSLSLSLPLPFYSSLNFVSKNILPFTPSWFLLSLPISLSLSIYLSLFLPFFLSLSLSLAIRSRTLRCSALSKVLSRKILSYCCVVAALSSFEEANLGRKGYLLFWSILKVCLCVIDVHRGVENGHYILGRFLCFPWARYCLSCFEILCTHPCSLFSSVAFHSVGLWTPMFVCQSVCHNFCKRQDSTCSYR